MIENLQDFFSPGQEFYLNKISYERIENASAKEEYTLNCSDSINARINSAADEVRVLVTRKLSFEPEEMFCLTVSFGSNLKFNPQKKQEYDWEHINLAEEFREHGEFVTDNLMSRISLLIAQITSSFGQQPLIVPPYVAKDVKPVSGEEKDR